MRNIGNLQVSGSLEVSSSITGDSIQGNSVESYGNLIVSKGAYINASTLTGTVTIPSNFNGLLVGPIQNSGSIDIQDNANLIIL